MLGDRIYRELIFGMLIGLNIWWGAVYWAGLNTGSVLTGFYGI